MKKIFTSVLMLQLVAAGFAAQKHYDFTKWSDATVAALKADAAASASKGWSDIEKADATAPTETSKDNCFWMAGDNSAINKDGSLSANNVVIEELKGLDFTGHLGSRALAIAVNYPKAIIGDAEQTYNGGSYLWLGGKNINYFVIRSVTPGTKIKIGVESHNNTDKRGIDLFVGETKLDGPSAYPTTYEEQEWTVPAGDTPVDVTVKNSNGCHLYYIDVDHNPDAVVLPDEDEEPTVPDAPLAGIYVANGLNCNQTLETSGTNIKEITYTISANTSFAISTVDEGFRKGNSNQGEIMVDGKGYTPVYMLSTSSTASKTYTFTKSDDINSVTMYAYYNRNGGDESATITLNPDSDNEKVTIYGFGGDLTPINITNCNTMVICGNGLTAVFVVDYGSTDAVESLESEDVDNVEAVYYNLQGVKVANPQNGIYVRVRGNKVDKVYVK